MTNPASALALEDLFHEPVAAFFSSEAGEAYVDACSSMRTAGGLCAEVSVAFADYLRTVQTITSVRVLDLDARRHPYIPDGSPHSVVAVRGEGFAGEVIVDLTHRQFDEGADLPYVRKIAPFLREWTLLDPG